MSTARSNCPGAPERGVFRGGSSKGVLAKDSEPRNPESTNQTLESSQIIIYIRRAREGEWAREGEHSNGAVQTRGCE